LSASQGFCSTESANPPCGVGLRVTKYSRPGAELRGGAAITFVRVKLFKLCSINAPLNECGAALLVYKPFRQSRLHDTTKCPEMINYILLAKLQLLPLPYLGSYSQNQHNVSKV
jgi:hypothetical protein